MESQLNDEQSDSAIDRMNRWIRTSTMLKLAVIGILVLVLLIPANMLQSLIQERESTRNAATTEVSSKWGGQQIIGGPVLSIPYEVTTKDEKGVEQTQTNYAHFLPDDLQFDGNVTPERRNRGIFVVMLYNSKLTIKGSFRKPDAATLGLSEADVKWHKAFLSLGISDMKGIRNAITFRVNNQTIKAEPGIPSEDILASGVSVPIQLNADTYRFESLVDLNGSTQLSFLPFGKETRVTLRSPWHTPSFVGSFLPDQRSVTSSGFQASWKVLQFNRNYPQQGIGDFLTRANEAQPSFGVNLLLPVDEYQKTMRSAKYGILFVILTFVAFFFVEILDRRRIHPIQYLLVGFAICLFYLLLLSISEHVSFDGAYLIGSIIILALITFYVRYVFQNTRLTILFSLILALLYGFFYSLLQLEDYSLLLGSFGLLLILGFIMYLTRHVDWYRGYDQKVLNT
ncbi:cell envelope integrity protein CreD [Spirosoma sp.]|uniref:cell envelope integrity protein CreD n=1 Tax=Spirosoma sp. TaxID=1899569 RepID=UPI003B3A46D5